VTSSPTPGTAGLAGTMTASGVRRHPHTDVRAARTLLFEYLGDTALTVFGGATRLRYRFSYPGARTLVDARDGASLAAIASLRRVIPTRP
jgi:hypothetical protein